MFFVYFCLYICLFLSPFFPVSSTVFIAVLLGILWVEFLIITARLVLVICDVLSALAASFFNESKAVPLSDNFVDLLDWMVGRH